MFIELAKGIASLVALCYLYGFNNKFPNISTRRIYSGFLFGSISAVAICTPVLLAPGVIIDARSIVLSMAGLFGGPIVAGIAVAIASITRIWQGGSGTGIGVAVITLCALLGLLYRLACAQGWVKITSLTLAGFGLFLHLVIWGIFQSLPAEAVRSINEQLAPIYIPTFTLATMLFGLLLRDLDANLSAQRAFAETTARLRAIAKAVPDVLLVLDEDGRYVEVLSPEQALVAPATQLVGKRIHDVMPNSLAERLLKLIRDTLQVGGMQSIEYEINTSVGLRHYEGRTQPLGISVNGLAAVVFLARDITERKKAETDLRESELRFRSLLRNVPSISVQGYKEDGTTTYWNKASEELYGYTEKEALGRNLLELIIPPLMREFVRQDMRQMFASGKVIPSGELQLQHKNGAPVDVLSSHALIEVPGQPHEMFCIDIDISRRKAAEKEARYLALYDVLTGLPNRRLLMDRLQKTSSQGASIKLTSAVMFVDLDNFKTLNDTRGHAAGDLLLQQVANRLQRCVRERDTVARLGGDEFVVILEDLSEDVEEATVLARRRGEMVLAQLRQPCTLADSSYYFSASIGIAMLGKLSASPDEVLQQADMAMYEAKKSGRNTLCFFDPEMQRAMNRRALLEMELHNGLRESQFKLLYQPQVDQQGRITGAEALVRWHHPIYGIVSPSEFIPLAEESGLILSLGKWVMEEALWQQARWRHDPQLLHLNLAINVSSRQFLHENFVEQVVSMLLESKADPTRIKLELTESFLLKNVESAAATMRALQAHGLEFALDDFGTGYSSLNYLKRLPLSEIKIDQDFVRGVLQDPKDASIARSIIELASYLGLHVIAEGVETDDHYRALLAYGCPAFQGYFFGRPMTLEAFEAQAVGRAGS